MVHDKDETVRENNDWKVHNNGDHLDTCELGSLQENEGIFGI